MKHGVWLVMFVAAVVGIVACRQKINEEPPLLLEDPKEDPLPPPTGPVADNFRCHVCHMNYEDEELAVLHARANMNCEKCHGDSTAHCSDEDNITPPDIMFPKAKINPFCVACHPKDKIETPVHEPILAGTATKYKLCIDCHGKHRLGYRTRKWDKATGKLLDDDKVRMMTDEMLKNKQAGEP